MEKKKRNSMRNKEKNQINLNQPINKQEQENNKNKI